VVKAGAFIQRSMERTGLKGGLTRSHTLFLIARRIAMMVIGMLMLVVLYFWLTAVLDRIPSPGPGASACSTCWPMPPCGPSTGWWPRCRD